MAKKKVTSSGYTSLPGFGITVPTAPKASPAPGTTYTNLPGFGITVPVPPAPQAPTGDATPTTPQAPETPQTSPETARVVSVFTRRALGGRVETVRVFSDGRQEVIDTYTDRSAGEAAADMFRAAGLDPAFVDSLMGVINNIYNTNIDPQQGQILNAIYNSDAYKTRFAGNEAIRKRIADGQGRPGDRLLTPREYIDAENTYRTILQDAGMPEGYYDTPSDFNNLISNGISAAEFKSRVDTAFDALNNADQFTVDALRQYYGLSNADLAAYLLDPTAATPLLEGKQLRGAFGMNSRTELQKIYEAGQVGGAAGRQGLGVDMAMSEEIVNAGKAGQAEEAFAQAGAANDSLKRLGSIYGQPMDFKDMVKETLSLSGGVEAGKKRRKFASKERAAFSGQGALDAKSLSRMSDV